MKTDQHRNAYSRTLAGAMLEFNTAIERRDKAYAHIQYVLACGMVGGATLSGGISKQAGLRLLKKLEEARAAFMTTFGEEPKVPMPSID
ncbi:hypothetical protein ACT3UJ_06990 [Halomonas sp. 86]|uniref:hypothetical protein n=1 Tax=unclassified Halomonas TaxID=2609666 RepID=UPI0040331EAB